MMIRSRILLMFFFSVVIGFFSCNLINPSEPTPSYIDIHHLTVDAQYTTQGTSASKITDVWLYVDNDYIGTYELPLHVPVLATGRHHVVISAGIEDNGIAATRTTYPFYKPFETDIDLESGKALTLDTVTVSYYPSLQYTWYEDFEGASLSIDTISSSQGTFDIDTQQPFEGDKCVHMGVNTTTTIVDIASNDAFPLPAGVDTYLELNYKCDQKFVMGIISEFIGGTTSTGVIQFNANPDWNKIYVNLKKVIGENSNAQGYRIWFRTQLEDGASQGNVYLDNLKLMHN